MIKYHAETRTFFLHGRTTSYVFRVCPEGDLEHIHYGKRVGEDDFSCLVPASELSFSPVPPGAVRQGFSLNVMAGEYGGYGQGDFRTPSALIARQDGEICSRFVYRGHRFHALDFGDLPCARGGETLEVELTDLCSNVLLRLYYTVFEEEDVVCRAAEFINAGQSAVTLRRAFSFAVDLEGGDYDVFRLAGRHLAERTPERTDLGHGTLEICSMRGASSHQMNPFGALIARGAGEDEGECYGAELLYSGSFSLRFERGETERVRISGGIDDTNFSWKLEPGERFITPQAALAFSAEGLGGLSRRFHDFLRARVIPKRDVFAPRPIVVNNWEATYFDFTAEKLFALIDEAAQLGVDTFVLDDGWFGKRNSDKSSLGDWTVNEEKLAGGLAPLAERCHRRGLKFGIWFEPEMVSEDSELFRAHPDWAIGKPPRCTGRNQYILDFSRADVSDYLYGRMAEILSRYGVDYVKWDMNRHMTEFFSAALPADRQGELQHRYLLNVYALARRLKKEFPDVFFEGCSGGGGRFDAGMLAFFPQIWTSDDTDAYERAKIQWGTSYAYPMSAMSCHVSVCPNHQTGRITPFSSRGALTSLGATGYELDLCALTEEEKGQVAEQIANYKKIARLVLEGDCYRLSDPFKSNYFAMMTVSKDKSEAYAVGMTALAVPADFSRRIRLKGLDGRGEYLVEELGVKFCGASLMNAGLPMPRLNDFSAWSLHLHRVG